MIPLGILASQAIAEFSPVSLGANLAILTTKITGKSDGDRITTWTGMPGTSRNATAAGIGPTYKTNIYNGKPILRFAPSSGNDVSNLLTVAGYASEPFTLFSVSAVTSPTRQRVVGGQDTNWLMGGWNGFSNSVYASGSTSLLNTLNGTGTDLRIHEVTQAGGVITYWVNGVLMGTATAGATPATLVLGGGNPALGSDYEVSNCDDGGLIGFPAEKSSGDRGTTRAWLAAIFGISVV